MNTKAEEIWKKHYVEDVNKRYGTDYTVDNCPFTVSDFALAAMEEYGNQQANIGFNDGIDHVTGNGAAHTPKAEAPASPLPDEWEKALVSLTPGGSEFVGDSARCVEWVKDWGMNAHTLMTTAIKEKKQLQAENTRLRDWKESAIAVMPDYQAIGKALNIKLGESVQDKILPGIEALKEENQRLQAQLSAQPAVPKEGYWQQRCLAAENVISATGNDELFPDEWMGSNRAKSHRAWKELKDYPPQLSTSAQPAAEWKRITLCGSTKFKDVFQELNRQLTICGNLVYSVAFYAHADGISLTTEEKEMLDAVHLAKIDNSDEIVVVDVHGYIGESTRNEINHALKTGKTVRYLSKDFGDWLQRFREAAQPAAEAVAFAEWILKEAILPQDAKWFDAGKYYTSADLYQQFKATTQTKGEVSH